MRWIRAGEPQSRARYNREAMIVRTVGTVSAAVCFPPPAFLRQGPRGQEREPLMVVPAKPIANLILSQPRVALRPLQAFLDPVLVAVGHPGELAQRCLGRGVRQVIDVLDRPTVLAFPQHRPGEQGRPRGRFDPLGHRPVRLGRRGRPERRPAQGHLHGHGLSTEAHTTTDRAQRCVRSVEIHAQEYCWTQQRTHPWSQYRPS